VFLRRLKVLFPMLFLLAAPMAHSQFLHTQGTEIVDANGKPLLIRGISIGNWFVLEGYFWRFGGLTQAQSELELLFADLPGPTHAEEFLHHWRQNFMSEADVRRIKEDGFNTIRIPLHTKYFKTDDDGPRYPSLLKDAGMQQYVNEVWKRVAHPIKDDSIILGYDLLNEPLLWSGYLDMEPLIEPEYRHIAEAIRQVDQPPKGPGGQSRVQGRSQPIRKGV